MRSLVALQASALALAGRVEEAKALAHRLLELHPTFRVQPFVEFAGFMEPKTREALAGGFRQAELPE